MYIYIYIFIYIYMLLETGINIVLSNRMRNTQ